MRRRGLPESYEGESRQKKIEAFAHLRKAALGDVLA
jgi:hypothetical protein